MYWIYTAISVLVHMLLAPYFLLWPARRRKYLPSLKQRLGARLPPETPAGQPCVWVHAVSVGEVLAVRELMMRLGSAFPTDRVILSTITVTGHELAKKHFPHLTVFYFPVDWGPIVNRFLHSLKPTLFISLEAEFWPNFYSSCKARGTTIAIVNGRMKQATFRNYLRGRFFFQRLFSEVDLYLMQTDADAGRVRQLGARPDRVHIPGNLKYDLTLGESPSLSVMLQDVSQVLGLDSEVLLLVAGSTMPGEQELVLDLFEHLLRTQPKSRLILAPRHPERFESVALLLAQRGLATIRRSQMSNTPRADGSPVVLLLDSIGELPYIYQLATLVFMGEAW